MKRYAFFVVLLLVLVTFLGFYKSAESTPQIKTNPYIGIYTGIQSIGQFENYMLTSYSWTDLTYNQVGATVQCKNNDVIIVVADCIVDAIAAFENGKYIILGKNEIFIIPTGQNSSTHRVYAKCNSADVVVDYIDNAVSVDKGVTPSQVGIPVTGHSFQPGDFIEISGTYNYDGLHRVISVSANEVVIYSTFYAEIFTGTQSITATPTVEITCGQ